MSICNLSAFSMHPKADERFVIQGEHYRFTVLSERILRLEYSPDGVFEDRATRLAFNRAFDTPSFESYFEDGLLHIVTKYLHLTYDEKPFSESLQITLNASEQYQAQYWYYGRPLPKNLGGTIRTLDGVNGATPLPDGLISWRMGFSLVDDSKTMAINDDGWCTPIDKEGRVDLYFFGYFQAPEECIRDFYKLSSPTPLLPRFSLGNWWSRYYKYTADEYLALMDEFKKREIPLSVGIVDMDWHITRSKDGIRKWTGFTFNEELFPNYKDFLSEMHKRGLKTALNLHPRDGILPDEAQYADMCAALGKEQNGKPLEFDTSSREFLTAYFEKVLHPYEDDGVDFWWLDWQQAGGAKKSGYDSLWMLNHAHRTDGARGGKRPLNFSRYAGIGSHKYPVGFSGDTVISWESLDFQPYFTATASNVGFSWWSHDIGGFKPGIRDSELYIRWAQLGVLSPVMRLHSTPHQFVSKEPWNWGRDAERIVGDYMRLRHRLVPYIFTMMYRNHEDGIPFIRPMYHTNPKSNEAYGVKNQYWYGAELIAAPITSRRDKESGLAKVNLWLPEGKFIDFLNGRVYFGNRKLCVYRPLDETVLLAKAGAIVPLANDSMENGVNNPESLEIRVFGGDSGSFTMVEDNDRIGDDIVVARTRFDLSYGAKTMLKITSPCAECVPKKRAYTVKFVAFSRPEALMLDGKALGFTYDERKNTVITDEFYVCENTEVNVTIETDGVLPKNEIKESARELLANTNGLAGVNLETLFRVVNRDESAAIRISEIQAIDTNEYLKGALTEILSAM